VKLTNEYKFIKKIYRYDKKLSLSTIAI